MEFLSQPGNHDTSYCSSGLYGTQQTIFISVHSTLAVTAFLGNLLIIVALRKVSSLHPPSKLLIGCLAITDLCVGLITQPLHAAFLMSPEHSAFCYYVSILFNIVGASFSGVSLTTLTAISVDRLLALLLGLRYRHVVTLRRVKIFVTSFWLLSIAVALTFLFNFVITILLICILVLLCLIISTACHVKIYLYLYLRHHQAHVENHIQQGHPNGRGIPLNIARYRKTVSSVLWIQITLFACYLPYTILALSGITNLRTEFLGLPWQSGSALVLLNSSLNPFLYCWKMREVRQAVKDTIRQLKCLSS